MLWLVRLFQEACDIVAGSELCLIFLSLIIYMLTFHCLFNYTFLNLLSILIRLPFLSLSKILNYQF